MMWRSLEHSVDYSQCARYASRFHLPHLAPAILAICVYPAKSSIHTAEADENSIASGELRQLRKFNHLSCVEAKR